jgi:serine/threonine-protein kinase
VNLETGKLGPALPGVAGVYTSSGHLVYVTYDGTVMGVGFDPGSLTTTSRPVALIQGLDVRFAGFTDFATSETGTLCYATSGLNAAEDFLWASRAGVLSVVDPDWNDREFEEYELSPDGKHLAVTISGARRDIWIKQLDRGAKSRLTFGGTANWSPTWSPDGRFVSFVSDRGGPSSIWRRRADGVGAEERIASLPQDIVESRWSRDGKWLLLSVSGVPSMDLYAMQLGVDTMPRLLLGETYDEGLPALSPDGKWLAYVSAETGSPQIFVRPFPAIQDGKWQISTDEGDGPSWSRDSKELLFRSPGGGMIYSVDMSRGPGQASPRIVVQLPATSQFETNGLGGHMFEMSPDGSRFLMVRQGAGDQSGHFVVVQNFFTELRAATASSREPR